MQANTINDEVTMKDTSAGVPAGTSVGAAAAGGRFRAGDSILGRYTVLGEFGQGGMGVVYRCLDTVGGVEVAVKGLPPEVSHNADEMDAIRANYQLVRTLRHPNIVGVTNLEQDAAGDYYLVMDVARGENLNRWMRRHTGATREEKLAILRQIASALDHAHAKKIIHRDVKPENVMVDEAGNVKVLDFGLAAEIRSSQSRTSKIVTSRSGTPHYKAPEQWLGRPQRAPADLYSFAVLAWKLFTGELPFDADDLGVLGQAVLSAPVPKLDGVPAYVNAAFTKALAKKPEDRFMTCAAFVGALAGTMKVSAAGGRGKWIVLGALALALVGGACWYGVQRAQARRAEGARQAAFEQARRDQAAKDAAVRAKAEAEMAARAREKSEQERLAVERAAREKAEAEAKAAREKLAKLEAAQKEDQVRRAAEKTMREKMPVETESTGYHAEGTPRDAGLSTTETDARDPQSDARDDMDLKMALILMRKLASDPAHVEAETVPADSVLGGKLMALMKLEQQRQTLLTTFTTNHPAVKAISRQVEVALVEVRKSAEVELTHGVERVVAQCRRAELMKKRMINADARGITQKEWAEARRDSARARKNLELVRELEPGLVKSAEEFWMKVGWDAFRRISKEDLAQARDPREVLTRRYLAKGASPVTGGNAAQEKVETGAEKVQAQPARSNAGSDMAGVQLWENGPYWAECNVGATKPEEAGYYFWWGDTVGYRRVGNRWNAVDGSRNGHEFDNANCPTFGMNASQLRTAGFIDETGNLVAAHDAARAHLGAPWRMPTKAELDALVANCTTQWTTRNGVWGRLVAGKGAYASKSIFLPAAGYGKGAALNNLGSLGIYWSTTPYSGSLDDAWYLFFYSSSFEMFIYARFYGRSVRPLRGFRAKYRTTP